MSDEMEKALKDIAEAHAMQAIDDVFKLASVYAASTESAIDDVLLQGLTLLKGELKKQVDKIDGEKDLAD